MALCQLVEKLPGDQDDGVRMTGSRHVPDCNTLLIP